MLIENIHKSKPWLVLLELIIFGFFNSVLLIISIMALRSLDSVFTSASQLLLLLPVTGCIVLVVVAVTFSDAQCKRYMERLDGRLSCIREILQLRERYPNRFLQDIFLPLLLTMPAVPFSLFFVAITTPWLLAIFMANLLISGIVVYHYNNTLGKLDVYQQGLAKLPPKDDINPDIYASINSSLSANKIPMSIELASYLLRDQIKGSASGSSLSDDEIPPLLLSTSPEDQISRRKREALGIIRRVSLGVILAASGVLTILKLSSLGSIIGFFIISSSIRKGFLALFEYIFPHGERITISQAYKFVRLSLLSEEELKTQLEERYKKECKRLQQFNQRYNQLIATKPYFRLRSLSIANFNSSIILDKLTSRIELSACTLILVSNNRLAQDLKVLMRHIEISRRDNWLLDGDVLCGGQKLTLSFLDLLPIRAPWKIRIASTLLEDAFAPDKQEGVRHLVRQYRLDEMLYGEDGFKTDLAILSKRQIQRMRSLICLIMIILEPACLSIGAFLLDPFEPDEATVLLSMIKFEAEELGVKILLLTRKSLGADNTLTQYELSRTTLNRIRP